MSVIADAKRIAAEANEPWDRRLETILEYCLEAPEERFPGKRLPEGGRLQSYVRRYYRDRGRQIEATEMGTKADPAVDEVLANFIVVRATIGDLAAMREAHRQSMSAENLVGALLESYVATGLEPQGWIWCCGSTVRAIDFLRQEGSSWNALQIKNRSNSENSSSSAIRAGTTIRKWHRIDSRTGKTFWDELPGNEDAGLTEQGFFAHIRCVAGIDAGA